MVEPGVTPPDATSPRVDLSPPYRRIESLLSDGRCVVLDGGVATEIERLLGKNMPKESAELWGTWALYEAPDTALEVHRRYLQAGCDIVSSNTWSILSASEMGTVGGRQGSRWMEAARLGIQLARQAVEDEGRSDECAVAFTISEEVTNPERQRTVELLTRVFEEDRPDLILMETLSLIRDLTFTTVETLLGTGLPVWLSFQRCLSGACGVYGQHWGGPEGDLFGRTARRLEEMGVGALMINHIPVDHVPGIIPWLRDYTDLPLGIYPNLGYPGPDGWKFDERIGPQEFAALASAWLGEGAQIIGGCCGVTPEHIAAVRETVTDPGTGEPRRRGRQALDGGISEPRRESLLREVAGPVEPWRDDRNRIVYPLPFPELTMDPGVFAPTQGSLLSWRFLFRSGVGEGKRCLDVGCGAGILAIQLALNGAAHVHAVDIDRGAVANALANAFRNGVADKITGETADIYHWEPHERYELIVASNYQMPVDPFEEAAADRPLDFWGRNILDHFIALLPRALADDGVAYVMQLSIISQRQTAELLARLGLKAKVVDFRVYPFSPIFQQHAKQIATVEELSDAYHLNFAGEDLLVAYLLEVTHRPAEPESR